MKSVEKIGVAVSGTAFSVNTLLLLAVLIIAAFAIYAAGKSGQLQLAR